MEPMIGVLIFVLVVLLLVWAAIYVIDKTMPSDTHMLLKAVVGVIGLFAVLYKLLPMAGIR